MGFLKIEDQHVRPVLGRFRSLPVRIHPVCSDWRSKRSWPINAHRVLDIANFSESKRGEFEDRIREPYCQEPLDYRWTETNHYDLLLGDVTEPNKAELWYSAEAAHWSSSSCLSSSEEHQPKLRSRHGSYIDDKDPSTKYFAQVRDYLQGIAAMQSVYGQVPVGDVFYSPLPPFMQQLLSGAQFADAIVMPKRTPAIIAPDASFYRFTTTAHDQDGFCSVPKSIRKSRAQLFPIRFSKSVSDSQNITDENCQGEVDPCSKRTHLTQPDKLVRLKLSRAHVSRRSTRPEIKDFAKQPLVNLPVSSSGSKTLQNWYDALRMSQTASHPLREIRSMRLQGFDLPSLPAHAPFDSSADPEQDVWQKTLGKRLYTWSSKKRNRGKLLLGMDLLEKTESDRHVQKQSFTVGANKHRVTWQTPLTGTVSSLGPGSAYAKHYSPSKIPVRVPIAASASARKSAPEDRSEAVNGMTLPEMPGDKRPIRPVNHVCARVPTPHATRNNPGAKMREHSPFARNGTSRPQREEARKMSSPSAEKYRWDYTRTSWREPQWRSNENPSYHATSPFKTTR